MSATELLISVAVCSMLIYLSSCSPIDRLFPKGVPSDTLWFTTATTVFMTETPYEWFSTSDHTREDSPLYTTTLPLIRSTQGITLGKPYRSSEGLFHTSTQQPLRYTTRWIDQGNNEEFVHLLAAAVSVVILIVIIVVLTIYVIKTVKVKGHPQVGIELTSCTNRDADGRLGDQSQQRHQGPTTQNYCNLSIGWSSTSSGVFLSSGFLAASTNIPRQGPEYVV